MTYKPWLEWPKVGERWPSYNVYHPLTLNLQGWYSAIPRATERAMIDLIYGENTTPNSTTARSYDSEMGPSLKFDNTANSPVSTRNLPSAHSLKITGDLTISCWFLRTASAFDSLVSIQREYEYSFRYGPDYLVLGFGSGSQNVEQSPPVTISLNDVHLAVTTRNMITELVEHFLDGVSLGTSSFSGVSIANSTNRPLVIGGRRSNQNPMSGNVSDIKIWDRVLSDVEIYSLWNPTTRWDLHRLKKSKYPNYFVEAAGDLLLHPGMTGHMRDYRGGIHG